MWSDLENALHLYHWDLQADHLQSVFKVGISPSKKFFFIWFITSPLHIMKDAFYFIWKAPFFLKIFMFYHDFLVL